MTTFKNDALLTIENMLEECRNVGVLHRYENNKIREIRKILVFLRNILMAENLKSVKECVPEDDIDFLINNINSDIEIMNIKFEDKISDENKIIFNKLTNNIVPYFYIGTDIYIHRNSIFTYFNIFADNLSLNEFILQRLSLEDKFKSFIRKEALIGTKTIIEYIEDINQKAYEIKNCFLNINISKKQFLEYLYKSKISNKTIKKIIDVSNVFFSSNNKITISNLYELVKTLDIAERSIIMYTISNIAFNKKIYKKEDL